MVCINNRKQRGRGVLDVLLKPFTVRKYENEMHSRSLDPNHFLQGYNYVGPHTALKLREQLHDDIPLNDLDEAAKEHDYSYLREKEAYDKDKDKQKHINNVHRSDDIFINKAKNSRNDPVMGNIASNLIATKKGLEESGLMDTKVFSGFGEGSDPVSKLRKIVEEQYKINEKKEKKNKIKQTGGLIPLAAIGLPIIGALAGEIVKDLYGVIKRKLTGSGVKMNHKTIKDKKIFVQDIINNIK